MYRSVLVVTGILLLSKFIFAQDIYIVDPTKSTLEWEGRKVTGAHNGTIDLKNGRLLFENGRLKGGDFIIDMTTIVNLDLEDEGYNQKLVNHLKSDDFFAVETYPYAKFKITDVKNFMDSNTEANYLVIGDLTIKGITKSIEFPANVIFEDDVVNTNANLEIDRSKFNVRYGSGSFFKGLGDKMIYDDFTIKVLLTALK
ncbi:MAG: YceI family protein [Calditrichaceae bacterium]